MRIERVIADSFAKASEQTRKLYGADCMVLSTCNVGDVTEILVAVDTPANDEPAMRATRSSSRQAIQFEETLAERISMPVKASAEFEKREFATHIKMTTPQVAENDAHAMGQGQVLVKAIRDELRAMERRLVNNQTSNMPSTLVSLLEQGVSARYAETWLNAGMDSEALAEYLLKELRIDEAREALADLNVIVCGPTGAGKTTLVMQLAQSSGAQQVIGLKDVRLGARERFFALADRAGLDSVWGIQAKGGGIVDGGALTPVQLEAMDLVSDAQPALICMPAHLGRAAAAEWLRLNTPVLGVVLTHWNANDLPLGLVTQLAEAKVPLIGVSASADVTAPLASVNSSEMRELIARKMDLVLYTDSICE